jgi:hypothetical protein
MKKIGTKFCRLCGTKKFFPKERIIMHKEKIASHGTKYVKINIEN